MRSQSIKQCPKYSRIRRIEIYGNMPIVITYYQVCDVMNFEIYHGFPIKPFSYVTKNSEQKLKYLKNERSFQVEIKSIFHHF